MKINTTNQSMKPSLCGIPYYGRKEITQPNSTVGFFIIYIIKIANILRQHDINPAFYTTHNICKTLLNNKDKFEHTQKSGVYKLQCNDCDTIYIGETSRCLQIRAKEHQQSFNTNSHTSHFAKHLLDNKHHSDFTTTLLHCQQGRKLFYLEQMEIIQHIKHNYTLSSMHLFPSPSPCCPLQPYFLLHPRILNPPMPTNFAPTFR